MPGFCKGLALSGSQNGLEVQRFHAVKGTRRQTDEQSERTNTSTIREKEGNVSLE